MKAEVLLSRMMQREDQSRQKWLKQKESLLKSQQHQHKPTISE